VDLSPPETELLRGARAAAMAAERAAVDQPNLWWFHQRAIQVRLGERSCLALATLCVGAVTAFANQVESFARDFIVVSRKSHTPQVAEKLMGEMRGSGGASVSPRFDTSPWPVRQPMDLLDDMAAVGATLTTSAGPELLLNA
jgi:hypothetical protein